MDEKEFKKKVFKSMRKSKNLSDNDYLDLKINCEGIFLPKHLEQLIILKFIQNS